MHTDRYLLGRYTSLEKQALLVSVCPPSSDKDAKTVKEYNTPTVSRFTSCVRAVEELSVSDISGPSGIS